MKVTKREIAEGERERAREGADAFVIGLGGGRDRAAPRRQRCCGGGTESPVSGVGSEVLRWARAGDRQR